MEKYKLIMVIVFEFEDSLRDAQGNNAIAWTERREYFFESKAEARRNFIDLRNKFRQDNPDFKTAFAIYERLSE
jgi:hypothetical protein